jgi:hypothetical protein
MAKNTEKNSLHISNIKVAKELLMFGTDVKFVDF